MRVLLARCDLCDRHAVMDEPAAPGPIPCCSRECALARSRIQSLTETEFADWLVWASEDRAIAAGYRARSTVSRAAPVEEDEQRAIAAWALALKIQSAPMQEGGVLSSSWT